MLIRKSSILTVKWHIQAIYIFTWGITQTIQILFVSALQYNCNREGDWPPTDKMHVYIYRCMVACDSQRK